MYYRASIQIKGDTFDYPVSYMFDCKNRFEAVRKAYDIRDRHNQESEEAGSTSRMRIKNVLKYNWTGE